MNTTNSTNFKYYQSINKYKIQNISYWIILALIGLFVYLLIGLLKLTHAQIIYPIPELGNCRDAKECYLYCGLAQNTPACWSYGRYILNKNVLGEATESATAVAKKYGIVFPVAPLGNCADVAACKAYCEIPSNHDACRAFAQRHKLTNSGETKRTVPGGCDSESNCRAYCQTHPDECKGFAATSGDKGFSGTKASGSYLGPSGCRTKDECSNFCRQHPSQCPGFPAMTKPPGEKNPSTYPRPTSPQTFPYNYARPTPYQQPQTTNTPSIR